MERARVLLPIREAVVEDHRREPARGDLDVQLWECRVALLLLGQRVEIYEHRHVLGEGRVGGNGGRVGGR